VPAAPGLGALARSQVQRRSQGVFRLRWGALERDARL